LKPVGATLRGLSFNALERAPTTSFAREGTHGAA